MVSLQTVLLIIIFLEIVTGAVVIAIRNKQKLGEFKKLKVKWTTTLPEQAMVAVLVIVGVMIFASLLVGIQQGYTGGVQAGSIFSTQNERTCNDVCSDAGFDSSICKDDCSEGQEDYGSRSCLGKLQCCCRKY